MIDLGVAVAIALQMLDLAGKVGLTNAAIEYRDMVSALDCVPDVIRPDEAGSS